ncbi:uncharacterized protein LOC129295789 isoform X2 [Prosopis cineraria]|uniref:uncharacterized protein LOC129295789 isoform X2 n=1 Tax=Prosopis cineraria TaxID=364024 RepID=UPI00240F20B0|nr:uncharacterized protein LOC129295789 isoform X2 [Prosopis cineraria]
MVGFSGSTADSGFSYLADGEWLTRGLKWREQNLKQGVVRAQEPASGCTLLHFKSGKSAPSRNTPSMFRRNNNVGGGFGSSSGLSLIFSSLFEVTHFL